jgi:ABC-type branched-subunit amino acid transport system substrate-binding protein
VRLLLLAIAACAARQPPQGSWLERDLDPALGQSQASRDPSDPGAAAIDPATLDAGAIDQLDEAVARAALDRVGEAAPAARLALRLARLAHHRGDDAIARALIARAATAADHGEVAGELAALAAGLTPTHVDPKTIAVLLPRSGRFAAIGSELELAIKLAPATGTKWLFLDTRGEADGAVAAVEQAVAAGAVAILGPVGQREAIAAARAATLRGIPIALLAPADGADPVSGVFRMLDSPADEGRAVARLAQEEGFPTVAVFAPRDDLGQEAAEAFVTEATRLGLQVTARGAYDPTGGALEPDVKEFLNLVPARNPRLAEHLARKGKKGWATFSPDINYSLLYVPDRHDRAALVAAYLPYFNVELRTTEFPDPERLRRKHGGVVPQVVQLVGGAGWNHPSLPIRGGAAVQGALIVEPCPLGGDTAAELAAEFQQRVRRAPSGAAAAARDAAALLAQVRGQVASAAEPRLAFRHALARARLDDGACGPAAMAGDGELSREPAILEVQGDQLQLVP